MTGSGGGFAITDLVYFPNAAARAIARGIVKGSATNTLRVDRFGAGTVMTDAFISDTEQVTASAFVSFAIVPTGSPYAYLNKTQHTLALFIQGGTISNIRVIQATSAAPTIDMPGTTPVIILAPGMQATFTYTVAPTAIVAHRI